MTRQEDIYKIAINMMAAHICINGQWDNNKELSLDANINEIKAYFLKKADAKLEENKNKK